MTEPHWPADGSGDEFDGGRDDSAPGEAPQFPAPMSAPTFCACPGHKRSPAEYRYLGTADPTSFPGDYESPHTAPFVQVRVNGELVPGHIVYPWPDGGLVVEPLEVAP